MADTIDLKNKAAVIGVGNTRYGSFPETDDYGLAAEAFTTAVVDCGIDKNEVDGLLVCRIPYYARMGEILGLNPRWTMTLPGTAGCPAWGSLKRRSRSPPVGLGMSRCCTPISAAPGG